MAKKFEFTLENGTTITGTSLSDALINERKNSNKGGKEKTKKTEETHEEGKTDSKENKKESENKYKDYSLTQTCIDLGNDEKATSKFSNFLEKDKGEDPVIVAMDSFVIKQVGSSFVLEVKMAVSTGRKTPPKNATFELQVPVKEGNSGELEFGNYSIGNIESDALNRGFMKAVVKEDVEPKIPEAFEKIKVFIESEKNRKRDKGTEIHNWYNSEKEKIEQEYQKKRDKIMRMPGEITSPEALRLLTAEELEEEERKIEAKLNGNSEPTKKVEKTKKKEPIKKEKGSEGSPKYILVETKDKGWGIVKEDQSDYWYDADGQAFWTKDKSVVLTKLSEVNGTKSIEPEPVENKEEGGVKNFNGVEITTDKSSAYTINEKGEVEMVNAKNGMAGINTILKRLYTFDEYPDSENSTITVTEKPRAKINDGGSVEIISMGKIIFDSEKVRDTTETKSVYKREDFPEYQPNIRTPVTQKLLNYFAEVVGIPKWDKGLESGEYSKWLEKHEDGSSTYSESSNQLGGRLRYLLNNPKDTFDAITKYDSELKGLEKGEGNGSSNEKVEVKQESKLVEKFADKVDFYLSVPNQDGSFNESSSKNSFIESASVYAFKKVDGGKYEVYFANDESAKKLALRRPDKTIDPIFEIEGVFMQTAKNVHTLKPAIYELNNGKFTLISKGKVIYNEGVEFDKLNQK